MKFKTIEVKRSEIREDIIAIIMYRFIVHEYVYELVGVFDNVGPNSGLTCGIDGILGEVYGIEGEEVYDIMNKNEVDSSNSDPNTLRKVAMQIEEDIYNAHVKRLKVGDARSLKFTPKHIAELLRCASIPGYVKNQILSIKLFGATYPIFDENSIGDIGDLFCSEDLCNAILRIIGGDNKADDQFNLIWSSLDSINPTLPQTEIDPQLYFIIGKLSQTIHLQKHLIDA